MHPVKGQRWFLASLLFGFGAFVLAWKFGDPTPFTAVATAALVGGHATNVVERRYPTVEDK